MDTLPDELKQRILNETAIRPFRRLVLSNVKTNPVYVTPVYRDFFDVDGIRLPDGSFAISVDVESLPKDGIVDDHLLDWNTLDEDAVLMDRSDRGRVFDLFCVDKNMRYICMYQSYNHWATPIGSISAMSHAMKSPLASVCKTFRDMTPRVDTTCVMPHKQKIRLNFGDKECETTHTLILTEACDPDNVLAYYKAKDEHGDWSESDENESDENESDGSESDGSTARS